MTRNRGRPAHDDLLTPAEWRIVHASRHGLSNRDMAQRLGVSLNAVKYHMKNILGKTGLSNKNDLRQFREQPKTLAAAVVAAGERSMKSNGPLGSIGQIARSVSDIQVSVNWYQLVLELPLLFSFDKLAFFDCQGTRLMLSQTEQCHEHESILYFRVDDILAVHDELKHKGVGFIATPHRIHQHEDGTEEWMAFFNDPDDRPLALMSQLKPAAPEPAAD